MMPNIRDFVIAFAAAAIIGGGLPAVAAATTLLGQSVEICTNTDYPAGAASADPADCIDSPVFIHTTAVVTDPGIEFPMTASRQVDLADDTVSVTYSQFFDSPSPDLFVLSNLWGGTAEIIVGLVLLTANNLDISTAFTDHEVGLLVNAPVCCGASSETVTFRIVTRIGPSQDIAEPTALALLGAGLLAVGAVRRRRKG